MIVPFSSFFPPLISFLALDAISDSLSWKIRIIRLIWWFSGTQVGTPLPSCCQKMPRPRPIAPATESPTSPHLVERGQNSHK